jgi:hypothetical protein
MLFRLLIIVNRNAYLQKKKDGNCHVLATAAQNAVGRPWSIVKRVEGSCWEMHKGYWKASGQLKGIRELLENAQIPAASQ